MNISSILLYGTLLSLSLGVLILASFAVNPLIWRSDFPAEVRAQFPPADTTEKRQKAFFGVLFMVFAFGIPIYSVLQLRVANAGALTFGEAFLHAYFVFIIFNVFDFVVIDYLVVSVWKPQFMTPPGVEGMESVCQDIRYHFNAFLKGFVVGIVFCLPIALVGML